MSQSPTQTVVLGFDALSMTYLEEFDLPNFESVIERGTSAPLQSTFPPWTGSAWPSMYTGSGPGHHGAYSFFDFDDRYPDEADLVSRNHVHAPAVWNYLSDTGVSSAVLNLPVTHPVEPIDGTIIPGYLAPEGNPGYPTGIRDELSDALGEEYQIYATKETGDADEEMLESYVELIDLRRRAARTLVGSREPDVAILQVQKTDTVFHQFDDRNAFRRVYKAADTFVGSVLDVVPDDANVILCSDHGIGPTCGYNVYVNEILREAGLVEATRDGETPTLGVTKHRLINDGDSESAGIFPMVAGQGASRVAGALSRVGIQPGDVYEAARRVGVDAVLQHLLPDTAAGSIAQHVDWSASQAYCRSGPELGVRINLTGREPDGVVAPDKYELVCDRVTEALSNTHTPDGEPAFDWVRRRETVYDGAHVEDACDVIFQPAGMNNIATTNLLGKQFVPIDKHNHKRDGVFIGAGPGFEVDTAVDRLSLTDIAPMVMALAGRAVPERMSGSVPSGFLSVPVESRSYGDVEYGGEPTTTSDSQVETRLEDLGYL